LADCDPGHDDACALILAGHFLNLIGVSTVSGSNASKALLLIPFSLVSRSIPIYVPPHTNPQAIFLLFFLDAGNVPLEQTTRNARNILAVSGLAHVPVVAGAAKPLLRPAVHCHEIHGGSGLDGYSERRRKKKKEEASSGETNEFKEEETIRCANPHNFYFVFFLIARLFHRAHFSFHSFFAFLPCI
jgi:inosine-uridine nucleoside N-ribohydrolase